MKIAMMGHKRIPSREGGVEIVVEELSTRMVQKGHEVTCYNRKGHHVSGKEFDSKALKEYKGVKLVTVPTIDKKGLAAASSSFFAALNVDVPEHLPRMTFADAMNKYGSDKPDTRFDMLIQDISDWADKTDFIVYCIEEYKNAKGMNGKSVIDLFNRYHVIDYIRNYYEALHTTGRQYIVDDISMYIKTRQSSLE